MANTTNYDEPRRPSIDLGDDSLAALAARRAAARSPVLDLDDPDPTDGFELPGADLSGEELTVAVVPMLADEFRCTNCFLVHHRSQLGGQRHGEPICRECG
ncbi:DUF4193 domain-containing protein [Micromonospora zhanjiangensis]|uniref:DUF4193 domain-containing protein n=1 Tax=Micromonospora zhanjiangensis TaxID=1522057 RepID=A0ABV8KNF4_9ACTN